VRTRIVLVALAGSLAFAGIAQAYFGELDPSFDGDGKVVANGPGGGRDEIKSVAVQSDGKIVVTGAMDTDTTAGSDPDFAVARYNENGSPDAGFGGGDGLVTTDIGTGDFPGDLAIQPDGKIVVAGECDMGVTTGYDVCVVRYNDNGTPDTATFGGGDGIVTTNVAPGSNEDYASGVAIESGGAPNWNIVVSGGSDMGGTTDWDFLVARYKSDGLLDTTGFGNPNGFVTTDFTGNHDGDGDFGGEMALQSDGKIVVAGDVFVTDTDRDFGMARYNTDGGPDTTFDGDASMPGFPGDGKVTTSFSSGSDSTRGVAIQGDGKIVAAGFAGNPSEFALARYNSLDGTLDTAFDGDGGSGDGKVMTLLTSGTVFAAAQDIAIQPDGKLVVAGSADTDPGAGFNHDFGVARYNAADGTLDPSFACDGTATTAIAPDGNADQARGVAVQSDGKIVAAGLAEESLGLAESDDFALVRYGPGSSSCTPATVAPEIPAPNPLPPAPAGTCAGKVATISGTEGPDQLAGTAGADVIAGAGGNDTISGLGGNDLICGGAGNDSLKGGAGKDVLRGEAGKDVLKGGGSRDTCAGGGGRDRAATCERLKSI
jgi:uncharacterized delta-60 repeat protein